jgi:hypothetical protein
VRIRLEVTLTSALALSLFHCSALPSVQDSGAPPDTMDSGSAGGGDAGSTDDAGTPDAGMPPPDAGAPDSGPAQDAGPPDAGAADSGTPDAGAPDAGTTPFDGGLLYDSDGPVPYTTSTVMVTNPNTTHSFTVTISMPMSPGLHPAVGLSAGSTQTAAAYAIYAQRLASWGIAVFGRDDPGALTRTIDIVPDEEYTMGTWMPANYGSQIDLTKLGLTGHSRGGAVSLLAAEHGLKGKATAWFGLDPVDNQFLFDPGEYARTDMAQIGIPTAFLGASVISNCAPAADGYQMLYPLSPSPSLELVGVGAGHTQLEPAASCTACNLCSPSGTADPNVVLNYAVRYLTAFFARELLGDTRVGAQLEAAGTTADAAAGLITVTSK